MKKIIINSPYQSGSQYLHALLRHSLPSKGSTLYLENIDGGHNFFEKKFLFGMSHENQIQVALLKEPKDLLVPGLSEIIINNITDTSLPDLLTNDVYFVQESNKLIKRIEMYYRTIFLNSDNTHICFNFEYCNTYEGSKFIIDNIFKFANILELEESIFQSAFNATTEENDYLINNNQYRDQILEKISILNKSINFKMCNESYNNALNKSIKM